MLLDDQRPMAVALLETKVCCPNLIVMRGYKTYYPLPTETMIMNSTMEIWLCLGDRNLDWRRRAEEDYYSRKLLLNHMECLEECGLSVANETFEDDQGYTVRKMSILDHVYHSGLPEPNFQVLPFLTTGHRPTLSRFSLHKVKDQKAVGRNLPNTSLTLKTTQNDTSLQD